MSFVWQPPLFVPPPHDDDDAAAEHANDNDHNPPQPPQAQPDNPQNGLPLPPSDPFLEENFRLTEQERQDALALGAL